MKKKPPSIRLLLDNKRHWPGLFFMVALAFLAGIFKTRAATLWGEAVDYGVAGNTSAMRFAILAMLLFIVLDGLRTGVHYTIIGRATEGLFYDIRMALFCALTRADMATLEKETHAGDIALRVCEDTERLCDIIAGNFSHYMRLIFQAGFAIVVCIFLSWQLAIAYFLLLPLSLWLLSAVSKPLEKLQTEARGGAGRSADIASGAIAGIHAVKIYGLEDEMSRRFSSHIDEAYTRSARSVKIGMGMTTIKYIVAVIQTLVLFVVGTWLVGLGAASIGAVMAFVALAVYVTEAFGLADRMIVHVKSAAALGVRVYEVLDLPQEAAGDAEIVPMDVNEYVRFNSLKFAYDQENPVLDGLNLVVRKGQKVAIVGPSGSGKSTIIKLICRLYGHGGGQLTLFGENGEEINIAELRSQLALVSQEASLFEGSILENVRYGNGSATEADIIAALKSADLWGFVSTLPEGIHTNLGEFGTGLSGGQRQRLSIARALVKDAQLVLMDEATSALDTKSEQEIQQALDNLLEGRAAVIVAHRLTTVQKADYIYCLDNGRVVEEGSPQSLLSKGGYYHEMCKMQGVIRGLYD
ncbi:MAG: ABC transporter ATP-binding protein/permease [Defluviitaleaceae bacterium]|nr:ABC transporter ATP-binding protein/permease [Defluviitaleaceae bacterium]